jgi:hypothetical protein
MVQCTLLVPLGEYYGNRMVNSINHIINSIWEHMVMAELKRGHYEYLKDTIKNDPHISMYHRDLLLGILYVYFSRDMNNFRADRWLSALGPDIKESVMEIISNDTSHTITFPTK